MGTFGRLMIYGLIAVAFTSYLMRKKAKKEAEEQASE